MKSIWIKLIAALLILTTICTVFAACETDDTTETDATDPDSTETEPIIDAEGVLTIFANKAYNVKVIRSDNASEFDKAVYNQIKTLLKNRTGVNPSISTDFVAANEEKYDGPAILIGDTNYKESIDAYKKLGVGEASANLVGNKYVIAFTTQDSVTKLVEALKTNINKASKKEMKINDSWNMHIKLQYYTSGSETFDETGLISSATVPGNLGTQYNAGQGSVTYLKTNATKSTFDSACEAAEANGFRKYTTNKIGDNEFATYVTQTQILHFMYFPNKGELRTAVDKRGEGTNGFTLPALSGENTYANLTRSVMTLVDIENSAWPGGMCLIFKLCDGRFVVVDSGVGGRDNDGSSSGWVYASLAKHADDPENIRVAAWIMTHIHSDHAGGLVDIARGKYDTTLVAHGEKKVTHNVMPKEAKNWIKIDTLIYNRPEKNVDGRDGWMDEIINAFKVKKVIKAHPGQVFYYANCKITMYGSLDLVVEKKISNHNDESLSMMFEFNGKKLMVLGDVYPQNTAALAKIYKENLKADIVQTAHHGYDNTDAAQVYEYVQASMVLWTVAGYEKDNLNLVNAPVNAIFKNIPSTMQFTPVGKNIDFDENWKAVSKYSVMDDIPYCDCSYCKTAAIGPIKSSGNKQTANNK